MYLLKKRKELSERERNIQKRTDQVYGRTKKIIWGR